MCKEPGRKRESEKMSSSETLLDLPYASFASVQTVCTLPLFAAWSYKKPGIVGLQ